VRKGQVIQPEAAIAPGSASTSNPLIGTLRNCKQFSVVNVIVRTVATTSSTIGIFHSTDNTNVIPTDNWNVKMTGPGIIRVPCEASSLIGATLYDVDGTGDTTIEIRSGE
jgi:hypothetical protein